MLTSARADARGDARDAAAPPRRSLTVDVWILTGLLILGTLLRFSTIAHQSFWFDEAQAAHEVQLSFGSLISSLTTHETNPPLFFVVGWVWTRIFGTSEAVLRSISALAGVACIWLAYACGRELVSRRAGLLAAAFTTVNPFMIWYSQEAREYMLLAALTAASLLWFARALRDGGARAVTWWAVFSGLALLTHFFAGFLIWPEALWLLWAHRRRGVALACAALVSVELALLPFALTHATSSLLGFIKTTPLSIRLEQIPVAFGLGSLYQSQLSNWGLLGAGVLVAVTLGLLVAGAGARELRGAGIAAALAACALVLPLLAALLGHDFLIARAVMPAWIPLAVVLAAACTARHARVAGGAFAAVLLALFVYGQVRVQSDASYQRPNWRGVAVALGPASTPRAIVLDVGGLASDPLAFYLPHADWNTPTTARVGELDVVGNAYQSVPASLPPSLKLIGVRTVDAYRVARFRLARAETLTPAQAVARGAGLLTPAAPAPPVLVQGAA